MVNNSMRCAVKAAAIDAIRLHSAAAKEVKTSNAADYTLTTASSTQPAAVTAVGSSSDTPRDIGDYKLELI